MTSRPLVYFLFGAWIVSVLLFWSTIDAEEGPSPKGLLSLFKRKTRTKKPSNPLLAKGLAALRSTPKKVPIKVYQIPSQRSAEQPMRQHTTVKDSRVAETAPQRQTASMGDAAPFSFLKRKVLVAFHSLSP